MDTRPDGYQVESATLPEQPTLVLRGTVAPPETPAFLETAFEQVSRAAREDGIPIGGPPFARVRPEDDGRLSLEAGFPVKGVVLGQGDVKVSHLPGGPAVMTTHFGDYAKSPDAHRALADFASEHGMRPAGDAWEVYLSSPDAARPVTLVVLPVVPVMGASRATQ